MAQDALFLGIDIGTSGCKALLLDRAGEVRATATSEYPLSTPRPLWSEQDPHDWWRGACAAIHQALAQVNAAGRDVLCIGLSGQMHGLVLLDGRGEPLRPAILWNDQRTTAECDEIHRRIGRDKIIAITGKPALPSFTAPKILWVRTHEPDAFRRTAHLLLPKDYVRYRLTGALAIDVADGSGTGLFDVANRAWSDEIIAALDIPRGWLPEVFESPAVCAVVSREGAAATGLLEGTPVVAGAGDQAAEAVGLGAVRHGEVSVAIGTSGVVFVSFDSPRIDAAGRLHAYCHAFAGGWHMMGVMLSAGGSLRWYRDTLGGEEQIEAAKRGVDPYQVIAEQAALAPPGCEGLIFLPYLTGERTPHADAHARGAFIGLTLRHGRTHLARAVFEGVTFGLLDCLNLVRDLGIEVRAVRVSGGGARSAFWRQMLADAFNLEIATVNVTQGAAMGAAILAAVGAGAFASVQDACAALVRETSRTRPGANAAAYPAWAERHRSLYCSLKDEFAAIAQTVASASLRGE
jgi:xylulokinase